MREDADRSPEDLFAAFPDSLAIYREVQQAVSEIGEASVRTTKSQVAFWRRRGFAYVWQPGQYVTSDVALVLSIALPHELRSDRFKSVVHPSTKVWMHHIELDRTSQVDDQVRGTAVCQFDLTPWQLPPSDDRPSCRPTVRGASGCP